MVREVVSRGERARRDTVEMRDSHQLVDNQDKRGDDKGALPRIMNDASMNDEDGTGEPCEDLVADLGASQVAELTLVVVANLEWVMLPLIAELGLIEATVDSSVNACLVLEASRHRGPAKN